jgi:hypothetical protein
VEEWHAEGLTYETLAICRSLELARAVFAAAIAEKPARPVHDQEQDAGGAAAPGGRLASGNFGTRRREAATAQRVGRVPDGWRRKRLQSD